MRLSESERVTQYSEPTQPSDIAESLPVGSNDLLQVTSAAASSEEQTTPSETGGFVPVLRNRNFLALWSGQVFSQLADKVYLVLMIAIIADRFQAENQTISGWVSAIMMAFTIPAVLFGSLAGVFVDRWHKKEVLVATNLLRGILVLGVPFLLWLSKGHDLAGLPVGFYILLGVTFLVSTLTQFFAPAEQATISMIVERRHLLSANSLYTTTMMGSLIIGFAVGEPVLALADTLVRNLGIEWHIGKEMVVGGSYAIAGLLLLVLKTGETNEINQEEAPHVLQDLKDGIDYLGKNRRIRGALIQLVILFSVFAAMTVLAVRMAEVIPGLKASQFGFILAAGGVGMGCGAAILGHYGQQFSHSRLSLYGSLGVAASLVGLSIFSHQVWLVLFLTILMGAFGAMVAIPMQTTIQAETPEEMRGKVFGLQNNGINIALTLPLALTGVAETFLGLHIVLFSLAAIVLAGRLFTWYIGRTGSGMSTNT
jgi:MFS family permease